MSSIPATFENQSDLKLFHETFEEVRVIKPRDFCDVLSNGETVGEFYRRTGKNQQNAEMYEKWVNPSFVSMCLKVLKKNPNVDRLPNGLTAGMFSIDHVTNRYSVAKKKTRKSSKKTAPAPTPTPTPTPAPTPVSTPLPSPTIPKVKTITLDDDSVSESPTEFVFGLSNE